LKVAGPLYSFGVWIAGENHALLPISNIMSFLGVKIDVWFLAGFWLFLAAILGEV